MRPPEQSPLQQAAPPEQPILDELLEEIFLRLPTAADLARASMACVSFRRVVAGHAFRRRFLALHPPPLLGILDLPFIPAQPPHPSAAAARAYADAGADFWCSFLPSRERWGITDVRDGRVLLAGVPEGSTYPFGGSKLLRDFAVCDPLFRLHLVLPDIPDVLTALFHEPDITDVEYFLAPPSEDKDDGVSFRVMCLARCKTKLVLFVFSRDAGQWRAVAFDSGSELYWASRRYHWRRCFCRAFFPGNKLLMLDTDRMEFSPLNLPIKPWPEEYEMTFVEAAKGRLGMFTIFDDFDEEQGGLVFHLWYGILRKDGDNANWWQPKAMISLPLTYRYYRIMGVAGGYLLLQGIPKDLFLTSPSAEGKETDCFSLNLQTLQLERFCGTADMIYEDHLYAGFPPSLSVPTI